MEEEGKRNCLLGDGGLNLDGSRGEAGTQLFKREGSTEEYGTDQIS